jgi:hypothetical protein
VIAPRSDCLTKLRRKRRVDDEDSFMCTPMPQMRQPSCKYVLRADLTRSLDMTVEYCSDSKVALVHNLFN